MHKVDEMHCRYIWILHYSYLYTVVYTTSLPNTVCNVFFSADEPVLSYEPVVQQERKLILLYGVIVPVM